MTENNKNTWQDFGSAPDQRQEDAAHKTDKEKIRTDLLHRLKDALFYLFPAGHVKHGKFYVGNIKGDAGDSLDITLTGAKAGLWSDFATGQGGDVFALWAAAKGFDGKRDFLKVLEDISAWLGTSHASSPSNLQHKPSSAPTAENNPAHKNKSVPLDDLGAPTGKWDYHDADGNLIACVYRYDTPSGKEFRPWDVKARKHKAPEPRPLYNQPGLHTANSIVLVEGEKCADALIKNGICATTAMHGANAPIDKTDWSPLTGKHVVIWPDNDDTGKRYAEKAQAHLKNFGIAATIMTLPDGKTEGWDAADAVAEGLNIDETLQRAFSVFKHTPSSHTHTNAIASYTLRELLEDKSPMPLDWIAPRVLTPGGFLVFGGAPKVGKSDFILSWLLHMAAGVEFLGMRPPRPLRIFILQAEIQYHYLRERVRQLRIEAGIREAALDQLVMTPQLKMILNEEGLQRTIAGIKQRFGNEKPDIIVIDPLRNVFDGGKPDAHENDNNSMLFFLQKRVDVLRDEVNPDAGIILVHHTSKAQKKLLEEDPFRALSGAGALRSYYTSGLLLYRPDESRSERRLYFELRNGDAISTKIVDKKDGAWMEMDALQQRLVRQDYSQKLDAERRRKHDVILQLIYDQATQGNIYTSTQFAEFFENKGGLGGDRTIRNRLSVLASKGYVRFFKNAATYGIEKPARTRLGYLCVEHMDVQTLQGLTRVLPTHYKCRSSGVLLPVEDPETWHYHDGGEP